MNRLKGIMWGILSGASFGLIPLFTLPLLESGLDIDSLLFYRFSVATLIIGLILIIRGENFRITAKQLSQLATLGVLYMGSALFLLWGYEFMPAGIATTIHFLYPVCVVLLMIIFFKEKVSISNISAVLLAISGVALLSYGDGAGTNMIGIIIVIISALSYATYIIAIKKMELGHLGGFKLTFYVLTITSLMFLAKATIFGNGIMEIGTTSNITNIVLLAFIPTVVSNFALVNAIKIVGSTTTSILGALEPMTAVVIGITLFGEPLGAVLVIGILLIISAVTTIVMHK